MTAWLQRLGAQVVGVSLPQPPSSPSLWEQLGLEIDADLRADICGVGWQADVLAFEPQVVIHLAAQSLVPRGYEQPTETFSTNVLGTVRVMDLLREASAVGAALMVTTDKVYDTRQRPPFDEDAFLGGLDPYSASKACAELVTHSWPTGGVPVATARAGNVIGGGDWSADRLLPDLVRSWSSHQRAVLRRPDAIRPWQHVLEPVRGYLLYAEALSTGGDVPRALNFGPNGEDTVSVRQVVECAADRWGAMSAHGTPEWTALGTPPIDETSTLTLDSQRAGDALAWKGVLDWQEAVAMTIEWHALVAKGSNASEVVAAQLDDYVAKVDGA